VSPETLIRSLLGERRASEYYFSLPTGEFEEHLKALDINPIDVLDDNPELYRLAGIGHCPVVYLEYAVSFETDVPTCDVLHCIEHVRREEIPRPRVVVAYLNARQVRGLGIAIRFMCIARDEPVVKRVAPKRARVVYECRQGERWVEIYFSKQAIPHLTLMTA